MWCSLSILGVIDTWMAQIWCFGVHILVVVWHHQLYALLLFGGCCFDTSWYCAIVLEINRQQWIDSAINSFAMPIWHPLDHWFHHNPCLEYRVDPWHDSSLHEFHPTRMLAPLVHRVGRLPQTGEQIWWVVYKRQRDSKSWRLFATIVASSARCRHWRVSHEFRVHCCSWFPFDSRSYSTRLQFIGTLHGGCEYARTIYCIATKSIE